MGDCCAVELAQTAHLGILYQLGILDSESLMSMSKALPRGPKMVGVVIDDLICFEILATSSLLEQGTTGSECDLRKALARFEELGLVPHPTKTFFSQPKAEFWGAYLEGDAGFVRASLRRVFPVLFATVGVIRLGITTISLLETIVGSWTSIFLFRRRMLSLLQVCYSAWQAGANRRDVIRLSVELKEELLLMVALAPLAATFLRTRDRQFVYASDASSWGWAIVRAPLPHFLCSEIHRHRLRKSVWAKLLSPLKSMLRVKGILPEADELPDGIPSPSHPLWIELSRVLQFGLVKSRSTPEGRHINVDELIGMIETERAAVVLEGFPLRFCGLADSQVGLGAIQKGRSSSIGLNAILQQSLPTYLGCGLVSSSGFLPSEFNPGDDPTRFADLRKPSKKAEPWMDDSNEWSDAERLEGLDDWLKAYKCSPWDMSGLPPLSELGQPYCEDLSWTRLGRFKEKCKKSSVVSPLKQIRMSPRPVQSVSEKACDALPFPERERSCVPGLMGGGPQSSFTPGVGPGDSGGASAVSSHVLDRWCMSSGESTCDPDSVAVGETPLVHPVRPPSENVFTVPVGAKEISQAAHHLLQKIPPKQFIFPKSWQVADDWRPSFAGYVDLYSGVKGVARAVVERGLGWAITFEIEDDPAQDVMSAENDLNQRTDYHRGSAHLRSSHLLQ